MAPVVERLSNKHKALNSNASIRPPQNLKKNKTKRKIRAISNNLIMHLKVLAK
jgi:hypothetical protein